jgi:Short C-terminal domain
MGLIKTGLKAAVAVKTAHYVHERIQRRQQAEWSEQAQPEGDPVRAVTPSASPTTLTSQAAGQDRSAVLSQLKELAELKQAGVLTEEEFAQEKALIMGG